jgi:lysophospholipase L1-like esterase|tara:strand:+ start:525 stop:1430 length:906 start_codon:yes stop_codon:yes gene_type:complete
MPAQFSTYNLDEKYSFDFLKEGKDILVVTIGDSWTWGGGLNGTDPKVEDDFQKTLRLNEVYGAKVAKALDADFLNLSAPGESNGWIANYFEKLVDDFDFSPYKKVFVVITMSEVAREWMDENDVEVDYYNFCADIKSIDDFFAKQSEKISNKVIEIEQKAKQKNLPMVVLKSIAFVEDNYPKGFVNVDKTWQECLLDADNKKYEKFGLYLCQTAVVEKLHWLLEYNNHYYVGNKKVKRDNPTLPEETFKIQRLGLLDKIDKFNYLIYNSNTNTWISEVNRGHPTATGHTIWANYIIGKLDK